MAIDKSSKWDAKDLSHRYTTSFFKSEYNDSPTAITKSPNTKSKTLNYYNSAAGSNIVNAKICAGLCISYMEANGIPYEPSFKKKKKDPRELCFNRLVTHLKDGDGTVLFTADIVDHYFRFFNED